MSHFNEIDVDCPRCQEKSRGAVWAAIHAGTEPELKELLLGGELNLVQCAHCGYVFFYEHFLLYQDPAEEIVAYVYREEDKSEEKFLSGTMKKGFDEAQAILPRDKRLTFDPVLLFGLESLIELLQEETIRSEESEVAQALCRGHHVSFILLSPARARALHLPRVIPYVGNNKMPSRQEILQGLRQLLELSPVFESYSALFNVVQSDPTWILPITHLLPLK